MSPRRTHHPGIITIGHVTHHGDDVVLITGWVLSSCAEQCPCHRHPANGQLYIAEDQAGGTLGLRSFVDNTCGCCSPWTATELEAVVRDLRVAQHIPTAAAEGAAYTRLDPPEVEGT